MKLEFTHAEIEDMVRRQLIADGFEPTSGVTFLPKKRWVGGKMTAFVMVKKELTAVPVEESAPVVQESEHESSPPSENSP